MNDSRESSRRTVCLAVSLIVVFFLAVASATAQIMIDLPTIRKVSMGRSPNLPPGLEPVATLVEFKGAWSFRVRVIDRATGFSPVPDLNVALPDGVTPADILYSTVFDPDSVLLLDRDLRVHRFMIAYDVSGRPKLFGAVAPPPLGNPWVDGAGTALAEAPNAADPKIPFLAVGTDHGDVLITDGIVVVSECPAAGVPVLDLATVPQVGYFAFVALLPDDVTGNRLVGYNPDADPILAGPQPSLVFGLVPDSIVVVGECPFTFIPGGVFEPNDEPLVDPAPVSLVGVNGTRVVSIIVIGECPVLDGTLSVASLPPLPTEIVDAAVGSLALLPADGTGLLYDPGFQLGQAGLSGTLLTVSGNSLILTPDTLKMSSAGQFITAVIEVADGGAADIDPDWVLLEAGSDVVARSSLFAPVPGDDDLDGNYDLKVKFDRSAVLALLAGQSSPVEAAVMWTNFDGSQGASSTLIRIVP